MSCTINFEVMLEKDNNIVSMIIDNTETSLLCLDKSNKINKSCITI